MLPPRVSVISFLALLLVVAPAPAQVAPSVREEIVQAVLRELLTSERLQQLRTASYASYICVGLQGEEGREQRPPKEFLKPFDGTSPPVVSVAECRIEGSIESYLEAEPQPETVVHHKRDGDPAILYRIGPIGWVRGDSSLARAEYQVNPLHGATYECDVRRTGERWNADCAVRFVS